LPIEEFEFINIYTSMSAKTEISNLPSLTSEGGLSVYLAQIKKFPILDAEEEYMLAKNWKERGNLKSAHKLVTSHLRLVAKIAMGYRGYGLPVNELISEGNIGLMQAVKKFDPEKGFRLATYAMWWIKAAIQEYVLRSWSLVKMGTTSAQKKLFFNLKKMKKQIAPYEEGDLKKEQVDQISKKLGVKSEEVVNMNRRMMGQEKSLNDPIKDGEKGEWQDWIVSDDLDQELFVSQKQEMDEKKSLLHQSIKILNNREREILEERKLSSEPKTLEELSKKYKISRERIRQIETKAFEKLQKAMLNATQSKNLLPRN
jgi:RNA polymerase sigma-32 factor